MAALFNVANLNYQSINTPNFTNIFANLSYSVRDNAMQNTTKIEGINSIRTATNSNFPRVTYLASGRIDKRFKNFKGGMNVIFNFSDFNNVINENPTASSNLPNATVLTSQPTLEINPI